MNPSLLYSAQRPLDIVLRQYATFDTFVSSKDSELVFLLNSLQQAIQEPRQYYLWGHAQSGKSHLLQAVCNQLAHSDQKAVFLPMGKFAGSESGLLNDMQLLDVVCIDDIDCVLGNNDWEHALFRIINEMWLGNKSLVISASCKPSDLNILLPDLASRLAGSLIYRLSGLSDEQKRTAIQVHAKARGLDISPEVCSYLLRHYPRELKKLMELLDKLDKYSLALQRKITVPFVRAVLEGI